MSMQKKKGELIIHWKKRTNKTLRLTKRVTYITTCRIRLKAKAQANAVDVQCWHLISTCTQGRHEILGGLHIRFDGIT